MANWARAPHRFIKIVIRNRIARDPRLSVMIEPIGPIRACNKKETWFRFFQTVIIFSLPNRKAAKVWSSCKLQHSVFHAKIRISKRVAGNPLYIFNLRQRPNRPTTALNAVSVLSIPYRTAPTCRLMARQHVHDCRAHNGAIGIGTGQNARAAADVANAA